MGFLAVVSFLNREGPGQLGRSASPRDGWMGGVRGLAGDWLPGADSGQGLVEIVFGGFAPIGFLGGLEGAGGGKQVVDAGMGLFLLVLGPCLGGGVYGGDPDDAMLMQPDNPAALCAVLSPFDEDCGDVLAVGVVLGDGELDAFAGDDLGGDPIAGAELLWPRDWMALFVEVGSLGPFVGAGVMSALADPALDEVDAAFDVGACLGADG